jgi:hypothetical protein
LSINVCVWLAAILSIALSAHDTSQFEASQRLAPVLI